MTTTSNDPKIKEPHPRCAAEWGLASLVLGGLLVVMGMLTLQINVQLYKGTVFQDDARMIAYAAILGTFVLAGMTFTSITFGFWGLILAFRHNQPPAFAWAGFMVSLFALALWIATFIDLFAILESIFSQYWKRMGDSIE